MLRTVAQPPRSALLLCKVYTSYGDHSSLTAVHRLPQGQGSTTLPPPLPVSGGRPGPRSGHCHRCTANTRLPSQWLICRSVAAVPAALPPTALAALRTCDMPPAGCRALPPAEGCSLALPPSLWQPSTSCHRVTYRGWAGIREAWGTGGMHLPPASCQESSTSLKGHPVGVLSRRHPPLPLRSVQLLLLEPRAARRTRRGGGARCPPSLASPGAPRRHEFICCS